MFNKIKNFLKKYKLVLLIVAVFLLVLVAVVIALRPEKESEDVPGTEEEFTFTPEAPRYEKYEMNLSSGLVDELEQYQGTHYNYAILDIDHRGWSANFANAFEGKTLEYSDVPMPAIAGSALHYMDQTLHYWSGDDGQVSYDVQSDLLSFSFETPARITDVSINPRDVEGAQKALEEITKKFFPATFEFEYKVKEVTREGNYYRVDFSRMINNSPIFLYSKELYFLATPDGRLKQGRFLLAEFQESGRTTVMSPEDLMDEINGVDHLKSVVLRPIDESVYEKYDRRFFIVDITGQESANLDLDIGKLVYYYTVKFQEEIVPQFLLNGEGYIDIQGEKIDVTFEVLTDATSF